MGTNELYEYTARYYDGVYEAAMTARKDAGFSEVTIYGDFDRSPLNATSPAFVVVVR